MVHLVRIAGSINAGRDHCKVERRNDAFERKEAVDMPVDSILDVVAVGGCRGGRLGVVVRFIAGGVDGVGRHGQGRARLHRRCHMVWCGVEGRRECGERKRLARGLHRQAVSEGV